MQEYYAKLGLPHSTLATNYIKKGKVKTGHHSKCRSMKKRGGMDQQACTFNLLQESLSHVLPLPQQHAGIPVKHQTKISLQCQAAK